MNIITLDFETYFDDDYTLSKMTTEAYIRDPRFEAHGCGFYAPGGIERFVDSSDFPYFFANFIDWTDIAVLCHHAAFDGLILSHHYGIKPAHWLCTMSMAAYLFPGQPRSLEALAERFGLGDKSKTLYSFKGRRWASLSIVERGQMAADCLQHCELTHTIFERMMKGDY